MNYQPINRTSNASYSTATGAFIGYVAGIGTMVGLGLLLANSNPEPKSLERLV